MAMAFVCRLVLALGAILTCSLLVGAEALAQESASDSVQADSISVDLTLVPRDSVYYVTPAQLAAQGPKWFGGAKLHFGIASHTRSGFSEPVHSDSRGAMVIIEPRYQAGTEHFGIFVGYTIDYSKRFSLLEYPRLEVEWIPTKRDHWFPIVHGSLVYARVKGFNDPYKFVKKNWGLELGARIDGPFESLRYSYNGGVGGYHRVDLIFAVASTTGHMKGGTSYSIYYGKYVRMIGVCAYIEGLGNSDSQNPRTRPIWHKALAWLALLPWLPMAFGTS